MEHSARLKWAAFAGSTPVSCTKYAPVVELVDTLHLGCNAERHVGSTPTGSTKITLDKDRRSGYKGIENKNMPLDRERDGLLS